MQTINYRRMHWTPILTSGGAATLFGIIFTEIRNSVKAWKERRAKRYFIKVSELFEILKKVLTDTSMDRWTVIKVHNGGHRLNLLSETFYSFLYEDYAGKLKPRIHENQKMVVDKYYNELFDQAREKGSVIVNPDEMPVGNAIKDMCEISGIRHSILFFLMNDDKSLFFLDISSNQYRNEEIPFHEMAQIRRTAEQVRSLFIKNMT